MGRARRSLYWVDGSDGEIWRWEPGTNSLRSWTVTGRIGSIALRNDGGALVAVDTSLLCFDFATRSLGPAGSFQPQGLPPGYVFNDGKVDCIIEVPPTLPSSVVFGGDDLEILYLTSIGNGASFGWRYNESDGGLFAIYGLGVRGRPEPRFDG